MLHFGKFQLCLAHWLLVSGRLNLLFCWCSLLQLRYVSWSLMKFILRLCNCFLSLMKFIWRHFRCQYPQLRIHQETSTNDTIDWRQIDNSDYFRKDGTKSQRAERTENDFICHNRTCSCRILHYNCFVGNSIEAKKWIYKYQKRCFKTRFSHDKSTSCWYLLWDWWR